MESKNVSPGCEATILTSVQDRDSARWFSPVAVAKGGAAGKGPDAPEPPAITTEGSLQFPSMSEELDGGDSEGKSKMAFAKMQVPQNIKEGHVLTENDFKINYDETLTEVPTDTQSNADAGLTDSITIDITNEMPENILIRRETKTPKGHRARSRTTSGVGDEINTDSPKEVLSERKARKSEPNKLISSPLSSRKARKTIQAAALKPIKNPNEQAAKMGLYA